MLMESKIVLKYFILQHLRLPIMTTNWQEFYIIYRKQCTVAFKLIIIDWTWSYYFFDLIFFRFLFNLNHLTVLNWTNTFGVVSNALFQTYSWILVILLFVLIKLGILRVVRKRKILFKKYVYTYSIKPN